MCAASAAQQVVPLVSLGGSSGCRIKVSSVLNRDVRQFGKKFMFDGDEETCWNSDQGSPQHVTIELPAPAVVREVRVRFQGGFVGSECSLLGGVSDQELQEVGKFYPKDDNSLQSFPVPCCAGHQVFKILFSSSSDFFGRVTIYSLQLYGTHIDVH